MEADEFVIFFTLASILSAIICFSILINEIGDTSGIRTIIAFFTAIIIPLIRFMSKDDLLAIEYISCFVISIGNFYLLWSFFVEWCGSIKTRIIDSVKNELNSSEVRANLQKNKRGKK